MQKKMMQIVCATVAVFLLVTEVNAGVLVCEQNAFAKQSAPDTVQSTASQLEINNSAPDSRKIYLRFNVSDLPADVSSASLIIDYKAGTLDDDIRVNLLNDGVDETWSNSTLTWSNAPGNNVDSGANFDGALTTLLTTTPPPGGLVDGSDVIILSGATLVDLINNERNGVAGRDGFITFALGRNGGPNAALHSLEGAVARGAEQPRIEYTIVPGSATEVSDDFNRTDVPPKTSDTSLLGAAWQQDTVSEWFILSGQLGAYSLVNNAVLFNNATPTLNENGTNFTLQLDVAVKEPDKLSGAVFSYQDADNFYALVFKEGTSQYRVIRRFEGVETDLLNQTDASITFAEDAFYNLTVTSETPYDFDFIITESGSSVAVNPVTNVVDGAGAFTGGYAGLYAPSSGYSARFDNFSLSLSMLGYIGWANGWGVDIGVETNDYDGDGLSNIYEYGLGGDPTDSLNRGTLPEFGFMDIQGTNGLVYIYPQLTEEQSGLNYRLELCSNLLSGIWLDSGYAVWGTNATGGDLDFVTNVISTLGSQNFIRLIIE